MQPLIGRVVNIGAAGKPIKLLVVGCWGFVDEWKRGAWMEPWKRRAALDRASYWATYPYPLENPIGKIIAVTYFPPKYQVRYVLS